MLRPPRPPTAPHEGRSAGCVHRSADGYSRPRDPDSSQGATMAGKFVLKKGASGKFHFNLQAGNGQVIATSEAYESKESALKGIESVKTNAPGAEVDDQTSN